MASLSRPSVYTVVCISNKGYREEKEEYHLWPCASQPLDGLVWLFKSSCWVKNAVTKGRFTEPS